MDDPNFVKWYAEYVIQVEGEFTYHEIPMHKCSEAEIARFKEPNKSSKGLVNRLTEAQGFMCIDWTQIELFGEEPAETTKTIDVMFLPCNMKETLLGGTVDKIPEGCNYDKQALVDYLGPI